MLDSMYKIWLLWSHLKIFVRADAHTWTLLNGVYVSDYYFTDFWEGDHTAAARDTVRDADAVMSSIILLHFKFSIKHLIFM